MTKRTDPLTQWRGSNTPYWLDKRRPDVEARMLKQMKDLQRVIDLTPTEESNDTDSEGQHS